MNDMIIDSKLTSRKVAPVALKYDVPLYITLYSSRAVLYSVLYSVLYIIKYWIVFVL